MLQASYSLSEIEALVLGQMLLDTNCVLKGREMLIEDSFFNPTAKDCFRAIKELQNVDLMTVTAYLIKVGYDRKEIASWVCDTTNMVASTSHFTDHCLYLIEEEIKWRLQKETGQIATGDADVFDMMDKNSEILKEITARVSGLKRTTLKDIWDEGADSKIFMSKYVDLDNLCSVNEGNMVVIAGRPGMGKTWFMLNLSTKKKSTIYSIEMSVKEIATRFKIMGVEKDVDVNVVDNMTKIDYIINDAEIQLRSGCRVFFVDYLQLIRSNGTNREQEIAHVSRSLKAFAKENRCVVFALSQLNREVEKRGNKKPMLADLRESGSLEQDADAVWMLYRPEYYKEEVFTLNGEERGDVEGSQVIIVNKNRHGERTGEILLKGKTKLFDAQIGF